MFVLRHPVRSSVLAITTALAVGLAICGASALPASAAPASSGNGGGGCYTIDNTWICVYSGGSGGGGGSGGSSTYACTYAPASQVILQQIGAGPPDPGYQWDIMTCPGPHSGPGALVEVNIKTRTPRVTPLQLLQIAIGELTVPTLPAATAPPRGKDGLVGLPEWFWVPAGQWRNTSVTVTAGPVWATAVATPTTMTFDPGSGQAPVGCHGPGTAFNRTRPAARQHTDCSYTYTQPSDNQPGNAYQAALTVTWTISWTGSGGAGGVVTNGYTTGTVFGIRVAQAEALVTTP